MSALGFAEGSIAGVALELDAVDCKIIIVDGARFQSTRLTNNRQAADGTVYTASMNPAGKGIKFGVLWESAPLTTFQSVIDAINDALEAQLSFNVTLTDGFHTINTDCKVDGPEWLSYPQGRIIDYVENVTMRFLTV